ncbi:MAG TPA: SUMF1/EgtB/PvdO family nonheme iron enzyme, partial [Bryobacteraceae bacterium]|nr:SUMF1/EgtB/PvdO family nonheme iron enzyme [Bryobacteraceae bacterium]
MERRKQIPIVFVSSTSEDLKPYRQAARDSAVSARFLPEMMEYFLASGQHPPLAACLAKVAEADVLVVIVAYRYGWVPDVADPKSITWLECLEAQRLGKEVLAFLVDKDCDWTVQLRESYRVTEALETGTFTPQLPAEVQRNIAKLEEFKQWLNSLGIRAMFANPDDLRGKVEVALREWRDLHTEFVAAPVHKGHDNPSAYLEYLREQTAWIDIRGLQVGAGKAYRFPIEDLYIPLTIPDKALEKDTVAAPKPVALEDALAYRRLVIVGDPGSGKTTFLRHVAYLWTSALLDAKADGLLFPMFIRISELVGHIRHYLEQAHRPAAPDSPAWLIDFLNTRNDELNWGLHQDFFRDKLSSGNSILLLDGLDEAPGKMERDSVARLFEIATGAYRECRFVVTTRPLAFNGLAGFETVQIEPLEPPAIEKFLEHWCHGLFPESDHSANRHLSELREALRARVEIRRMARNPVMLTALAVVHWNERRLPEQRADLYESILMWLARAREKRPGRESAERCLTLLQQLALAMQNHPKGRQVQVEKGWAADVLAPQFSDRTAAIAFVEQEEVDSGIIVSRGSEVRLWHLTFQEYLAARAIAGLADTAQHKLLMTRAKIYKPEWREVGLLLAGVLIRQGQAKVDGLFAAALDRLGPKPKLVQQARCAGILGAMVRDLRPLNYQPSDSRYGAVLEAIVGIFDAEKAAAIDFRVRLDAAEALGQAGDPRLNEDNWVTIKACAFSMAAQSADEYKLKYGPEAHKHEEAVRLVKLSAYQIGRFPVTVSEYRRFIEADGYREDRWWSAGGFGQKTQPWGWDDQMLHSNRPVVGVTWYEASAYCAWAGARLPAEAQWERAARGMEGREYPWGNEVPDRTRCNFDRNVEHVTPVGLYPAGATPEGVHDLVGNMLEWVHDQYMKKERRRVRGASYVDTANALRAGN